MITESTIYWITRLGTIHAILIALAVISMIAIVITLPGIVAFTGDKVAKNAVSKMLKWLIMIATISMVGLVFIPTTQEMCAIKVIPQIANNQNVQQIGESIVVVAKDWLEDLKTSSKKEMK